MLKSTIELRDYQENIVSEVIKHREGVVHMSTGSGKTVVGVEIIARLGLTVTILTHTKTISSQWKEEIERYLDIKPCVIDAGSKEMGQINIATIQSLQSDEELCRQLASKTSVLLVDECHLFVSDKRIEILNKFSAKYMYGFSGSPEKDTDDGRTPVIFFVFGNKLCQFEMTQMKPTVEIIQCRENLEMGEYHEIIDSMVNNDNRNSLIFGVALGEMLSNRRILILVKRISHGELIYNKFSEKFKEKAVYLISSSDKERDILLNKFRSGEKGFSIIIGTSSLLATGVNIPQLDLLIMAHDLKSIVLNQQSVGRILRIFEGKANPRIIDIQDSNPILRRQAKIRNSFYRSRNWQITGI